MHKNIYIAFWVFLELWLTTRQFNLGPSKPKFLASPLLLGLLLLYRFNLKSLPFWGITFSFPFPCNWPSSILLYLSIRSIGWRTLVTGLPIKDFLKSCSVGMPLLKVLMATSSKFSSSPFYLTREGWLKDLIQSLTHGIITQASTRWAHVFSSMTVLVFIREGLTWRNSWSLPVISFLFIIRAYVKTWRRLPPLGTA